MVGIVVVSHSHALARAAVVLAEEMLQGRPVAIVLAAGLGEHAFGTDAVRIRDAIVEADGGDGVVVLMDLGSAVLSAELALELLDGQDREQVLLCPAPLVEGLVVAAVSAAAGAGRDEVAAEALAALAGKQSHFASDVENPLGQVESGPEGASVRFVVTTEHGLHARPAARLVALVQQASASSSDAQISVELRNLTTGSGWVPGSSLSRVATLGALKGHEVEVRASGPAAGAILEGVLELARGDVGEAPATDAWLSSSPSRQGGPFAASPGIGAGRAAHWMVTGPHLADLADLADPSVPADPDQIPHDPAAEQGRLDDAVAAARTQLAATRAGIGDDAAAQIFDAHLALLGDPELLSGARGLIQNGQTAGRAWAKTIAGAAAGFEALPDPYLRSRADDVVAVGEQVLAVLAAPDPARGPVGAGPGEPGFVLIAADLSPAQAASLDPEQVAGVVLALGSPAAHSAILLRARGIPAVTGAGPGVLQIAKGTPLVVDGTAGQLLIDPPAETMSAVRLRTAAARKRHRLALAAASASALTRDGVMVRVGANLGSLEEARDAADFGADLVGLVRTEFLFLGRAQGPDVEEQEAAYRAMGELLPGRRITLRTLDIGGDKQLDYLPATAEANPFLGVRGLRLALRQPQLLAEQLLAMVRVAHDTAVSVMFPMVSTLDELIRARRILDDAISRDGRGEPVGLQVGIMIEVPAAALKTAIFAPHVDFFSIGTNDLTQYSLAAERGNAALAGLADPLDPGVLKLIKATCDGAGGRTVAVCGELAADELATAVLIGLGVRELSVTPRAVPGVKQAVRKLALTQAQVLAARALDSPSADAVRALLSPAPEDDLSAS